MCSHFLGSDSGTGLTPIRDSIQVRKKRVVNKKRNSQHESAERGSFA